MSDISENALCLTAGELPRSNGEISIPQKPTIDTFYQLVDAHFGANERNNNQSMMRFNTMAFRWEIFDIRSKDWREWTDADESRFRTYFQTAYGMYNERMLHNALVVWFDNHKVNPLTDILDSLKWDGKPRTERFLTEIMKAPDTPYIHECSRLIFAGGIHRAYRPGCQFDDMIVLMGSQGNGKTTAVRWLNLDDRFYGEIKTIHGKEGIEATQGLWIAEVVELMAMTNAKDVESVKAYVTGIKDRYRPPYGRNVVTLPRRCCFIGTTNSSQFLTDRTGNRRFYPVFCKLGPYELHDRETEVKAYISQAWAEAVYKFNQNQLPPYAKREILKDIRTAQANALEDDWRVGAIEQYLSEKTGTNDTVCIIELWHKALRMDLDKKPTRRESNEIAQIMQTFEEWRREDQPAYTLWGRQKVYKRIY